MSPKTKNALAVVAGFLTVVVLSVATDAILEKVGYFPPASAAGLFDTRLLLIAFAYRSVYTVAGGFVTARLAADRPMRFVSILGIIGTVAGTLGVIAGWKLSQHWYPIALAVTAWPFTHVGGRLMAMCATPPTTKQTAAPQKPPGV